MARGLARPPRPTQARGFPFHLELGAPGSERDGRRALGVSQNLGDSAFSGALWPRGFDILSGNGKKGEQGAAGRRSCGGGSGSRSGRRPRSQEDYSVSVGGLACDPSLLRTTLSGAAISGFGGCPPAPCPLPSPLLTSADSRSFPRVWQLLLWPQTLGRPPAQGQRAGLEGQQPGSLARREDAGGRWPAWTQTSRASKAEGTGGRPFSFAVALASE